MADKHSNAVPLPDELRDNTLDFLAEGPADEVAAFFRDEGLDVATLAAEGKVALAAARRLSGQEATHAQTGSQSNPFASLERSAYRNLAKGMGINTMFLNRIRDRDVRPGDFPARFLQKLAASLAITVDALRDYLTLPATPVGMFRSDSKPTAALKGSFETAASESGLSDEEIKRLFD